MSGRANRPLVLDGPLEIAAALVMRRIAQFRDATLTQVNRLTLHAKFHVASVASHARALLSEFDLRTAFRTWSNSSFELLQVVHVVEIFSGREIENFGLRCPDSPVELPIHESFQVGLELVASLAVVLLVTAGSAVLVTALFTCEDARFGVVLLNAAALGLETLALPVLLHLLLSLAVEEAMSSLVNALLLLGLETADLLFLVPLPEKPHVK